MRSGRKSKTPKSELAEARAALARKQLRERKRLTQTFKNRERKARFAVGKFKPAKRDRGTVVFIGVRGGRLPGNSARRGYAVYVNGKGRKIPVRQLSKVTRKLEKTPVPRKLTAVDLSRVRSKKARRKFFQTRLNPVARAALQRKGTGVSRRGTRYSGQIVTNKFYEKSSAIQVIAKELAKAVNSTRSKKDFLVTIGIVVRDGSGKFHWIEIQRRFSRQDKQKAELRDVEHFLSREVYAFLAKELADRNLVLSGSARHIARLKANRGKPRSKWQKDGFLWQGHDMQDVTIDRVEYRFDQLTLTQ